MGCVGGQGVLGKDGVEGRGVRGIMKTVDTW